MSNGEIQKWFETETFMEERHPLSCHLLPCDCEIQKWFETETFMEERHPLSCHLLPYDCVRRSTGDNAGRGTSEEQA
jgi:hypothetical protein